MLKVDKKNIIILIIINCNSFLMEKVNDQKRGIY